MSGFMSSVVGVLALLITVAIIAELLSKNAQTSTVISSFFTGFANVLKAAVSPLGS